ncbi:MAG: hypothetical protein GY696_39310, partial [Gammaproteobacteria bacterium]|nr:hypothetical protein [Gammaproteobacteria bacterium]
MPFHPPDDYMPEPGATSMPWTRWQIGFNCYIHLKEMERKERLGETNYTELSSKDKNTMLFMALGKEGQRQFLSLPGGENFERTFTDFMKDASTLFQKKDKVHTLVARNLFLERNQLPSETITDWLTELRIISASCQWHDEEDLIATRLIHGCYSTSGREKVFTEHPDSRPEFDLVLRLLNADEKAKAGMKQLKHSAGASKSEVGAVSSKPERSKRPPWKKPEKLQTSQGTSKCLSCGKLGHNSSRQSPQCPARIKECRFCGKIGHFDYCCWEKNPDLKPKSLVRKITTTKKIKKGGNDITCKVTLQAGESEVPLEIHADCGSDVTIIEAPFYKKHFGHIPLTTTKKLLRNYDKSNIKGVQGTLRLKISCGNREVRSEVFVVDKHEPCLGKYEMKALNVQFDWENFCVKSVKKENLEENIRKEFPNLFSDKIGKVPNYRHKIYLSENAQPTSKKLRTFPVAIQPKISAELKNLQEQGIITPCERSEWVHALVAAKKKDSDEIRICGDMTSLNPYVIPERHPLPNMKQIFTELSGAKVFSKLDVRKAYWHIELDPASRPLTAFLTKDGLFQWNRLTMGLKDSASAYQKVMTQILAGIPDVYYY